jgi:hypothetical protein
MNSSVSCKFVKVHSFVKVVGYNYNRTYLASILPCGQASPIAQTPILTLTKAGISHFRKIKNRTETPQHRSFIKNSAFSVPK